MNQEIYNLYRPLRNHLKHVSLIESLGVIRAYSQHLQFDQPFPNDIEVFRDFLLAKNWIEKKIYPWDLETLARETIINAQETDARTLPKTLRRWSYFAGAINKLRKLDGMVSQQYPAGAVLLELHRSAHRQFPWQLKPSGIWLGRYFKIFSHSKIDSILQRVIGLTAKELYTMGLALIGLYLENLILYYPPDIQINSLNQVKFDRFLSHFSNDLSSLKKELIEAQSYDEKYLYTFNPLRAYPLVRINFQGKDSLACPIPTLLFRRFTEGIFYEICHEDDFAAPFGESFQGYVGDTIKRGIEGGNITVHPEKEYYVGKERKDTVDWIVDDGSAALFIECKTKRIRLEAKSEILSTEILMEELDKLADFIIQIYKTIRDYRNNSYPGYPFDSQKRIFPLVLTLEEWFAFGDRILGEIDIKLKEKFAQTGLNESWLTEMPFSICSIEEFEKLVQVIPQVGIGVFMKSKTEVQDHRFWPFHSYISSQFSEQYRSTRDLFPEILDQITDEALNG